MVDPFGLCAEPGSSSKSSGNWWSKMTSGIGNYFSSWSFNDVGHTFLDGAGMIPVIGFAFDGTNALWYLAAGDMVNAGLSGTALIPVVRELAGGGKIGARVVSKAIGKSVKYSDKMVEATEIAVKSEDKIADIGKIADDVVEGSSKINGKIDMNLQFFAKKADIKQIESIAKDLKMTSVERRGFGDYVESLKEIVPNNKNFSYSELRDIAKEFLGD